MIIIRLAAAALAAALLAGGAPAAAPPSWAIPLFGQDAPAAGQPPRQLLV
jgi:hypothetical protein